jgi:glutamate-1-semialdehyde aminotransferase
MNKVTSEPVIDTMNEHGQRVIRETQATIERHGLTDVLGTAGHPSWSFLTFQAGRNHSIWEIKTLFMQEVLKRGILALGTHNMSYAHTGADIDRLGLVYDEVFAILAKGLDSGIKPLLQCEVLEPLFRVR